MRHVNSYLPGYRFRSNIFQWDPCKFIFRKPVHTQLLHVNMQAQYVCLHTHLKNKPHSRNLMYVKVPRTNSDTCVYTGV